jgi:hypothetical protein
VANLPFLDFYDHLLPYLPGAEPGVVDLHIRKILKEFLRRTTIWREVIVVNPVVSGALYALVPAQPIGRVSDVLRVGHGTSSITLPNIPEHMRVAPGSSASPRDGWYVQNLPYIYLATSTGLATVEVALTLTLEPGVVEFPDFLLNNHSDVLTAGILASLMAMPGKPWTQFDMAKVNWTRYVNGVLALRASLRDGGAPNASTITGPRFGA